MLGWTAASARADDIVLAVGAPGEEGYEPEFAGISSGWRAVADRTGSGFDVVAGEGSKAALREAVAEAGGAEGGGWLWVVLAGHGSFDGRESKFNLTGEDVSSSEMGEWLGAVDRPVVLVVGTAASAPFVNACSGSNRIVVTATKHPSEVSYAHFGKSFAEAIGDGQGADLDLDGGVSVLEAFLVASRQVADFYSEEGRLASEEAVIDDNGDGRGTPAKSFDGVRPTQKPDGDLLPDGVRAHQVGLIVNPSEAARPPEWRRRRDELELEVYRLREQRTELGDGDYFAKLKPLMLDIAALYEPGGGGDAVPDPTPPEGEPGGAGAQDPAPGPEAESKPAPGSADAVSR